MIKKTYLLPPALLWFGCLAAQPEAAFTAMAKPSAGKPIYKHEIVGVTENDNYTLQLRDGYYTNGLLFDWYTALNKARHNWYRSPRIKKVVRGVHIGQKIYNPVSFDRATINVQDRPFAGYLFAGFDHRVAYAKGGLLTWSATIGTIGPNSFAADVQSWYHNAINIYPVDGWPTQLRNELSLNLGFAYTQSMLPMPVERRRADIAWLASANLGNATTNASAGLLLRAGRMESNYNTVHWNTRVSTTKSAAPIHHNEIYGFVQPSLTAQAYEAVLQGGLFLSNKGPFTVDINPLVFSLQAGVKYAQNRWTANLHYLHRSRAAKGQERSENLVSIQLGFRFGKA
jgi:lipid A 3-O-deacylase